MDFQDLLSRFALALGVGLLIGLERGWRTREEAAGSRTAGIRTFTITGLLGAVVGTLAAAVGGAASAGGGVIIGIGFATYAVAITIFCLEENRADKTFSATTAVAAILTFALGCLAVLGDMRIVAASAVAATALLALRENLHQWVKGLTWPELRSGLVLLAMTFVALPIVPSDPIGPYGGVNPREVWLIAIVLASVSFLGYAAIKRYGASRGELLAAAAGGLVSSTAVTLANARRAGTGEGVPRLLAAGIAVATAISLMRVGAIVAFLQPSLLVLIAAPLVAAAAVGVGIAIVQLRWRADPDDGHSKTDFRNPFSFRSVVVLALSMGVIILVGRMLNETFGSAGVILGAATLGLFDVDAVTVSMARLVPQPLGAENATYAILAAVVSNTLSKVVIGAVIGRGRFAVDIAIMAALCLVTGGLVTWVTFGLVT